MKKVISLLKASPAAMVIAGLLMAGVTSAALLTIYVKMTGTAEVEQSVVFGNGDVEKVYTVGDSPAIAGNTYTQNYNLLNKSETTAPIKFLTTQCVTGSGVCDSNPGNSEPGITTSYWSAVELENKDTSTWQPITDGTKATLTYELVSPALNYKLAAQGLTPDEEYSLIYYADQQDRFVNWGGDNPGALIASGTPDASGNLTLEGSVNLKMNLPHPDDWNGTSEANYCDKANGYDDYDLCRGAKIWLVPSSDYDAGTKKLTAWNPTAYLFETDLITYDDSDTDGEALYLGTGMLNLFVKNVFAIDLAPQSYTIKTEVQPAP